MLKEIPELRAPENSFTGIEIRPKVKYPDQTEAAIVHPKNHPYFGNLGAGVHARAAQSETPRKLAFVSLNYIQPFDAQSCPR